MKILFVVGELGFIDPMGVAYLSAVAKSLGHETFFCALTIHDFMGTVDKVAPDVIAYSAFSSDIDNFERINRQAKKVRSFVSVIGGPHPTFCPSETVSRGFDVVVVGEGEHTFRDVLVRLATAGAVDGIPGTLTRAADRVVIRPLIQNLNELPFPDRDLVLGSTFLEETSKKTFFSGRGCPYRCTYCLNPALKKLYKGQGKFIRKFSVERVIDEILYIKKHFRLDFVKFDDDVFAVRADAWLAEFSETYARRVGLPFNCLLRLDHADDDLLEMLKHAGCHSITTSIDSASDSVRRTTLNRKMSNEVIIDSLQKIDRYGIKSFVNFILDLPGSSLSDDLRSIELARQARATYINYTFLTLFPGTEIRRYCIDNGIIDETYTVPLRMCEEPTLTEDPEERRIKRNIMDLGHAAMSSPPDVKEALMETILTAPNSDVFKRIRETLYKYNMERVIYKCDDDIDMSL